MSGVVLGQTIMSRRGAGARAQAQAAVRQHSLPAGPAQDARHPQPPGLCAPAHRPAGRLPFLCHLRRKTAYLLRCAWQTAQCLTTFIGPCHHSAERMPLSRSQMYLCLEAPDNLRMPCARPEAGLLCVQACRAWLRRMLLIPPSPAVGSAVWRACNFLSGRLAAPACPLNR